MAPLSHKKDRGTSKSGFALIDQSVTLNFELSYNERTLTYKKIALTIFSNSGPFTDIKLMPA